MPDDLPIPSGPPPATLRARRGFLACARAPGARRQRSKAFLLQACDRGDSAPPRVGYTCSRKVGGAVERNRARRRLREAARAVLPRHGRAGWDYVLVGFAGETARRPFAALIADLVTALGRVHR